MVDEVNMHRELSECSTILQLLKIFESKDSVYLMVEYEEGGDLVEIIEKKKKLNEVEVTTIMS